MGLPVTVIRSGATDDDRWRLVAFFAARIRLFEVARFMASVSRKQQAYASVAEPVEAFRERFSQALAAAYQA